MSNHSLKITGAQNRTWNQCYFDRSARHNEKASSENTALTKNSLLMRHLAALELVEHCTAILRSPDHRVSMGTVRRYHENSIRFFSDSFPEEKTQRSDRVLLTLAEAGDRRLTNDPVKSLLLLKRTEDQLRDAHLTAFKDPSTPSNLQTYFGIEVLETLTGFVDGIERVERSIP